ncbi:hypothetical protein EZS27_005041 [termite gut metagenome]|uniref:Uncharacterized protein n=1 Tax=termite gut metagenome TaxID=433724 RepID=A0A5J4SMW9_9ZZZZ
MVQLINKLNNKNSSNIKLVLPKPKRTTGYVTLLTEGYELRYMEKHTIKVEKQKMFSMEYD